MTTTDPELLKLSPGQRQHLKVYRSNASLRRRKWELTPAQAKVLFESNCYWCGEPPHPRKLGTYSHVPLSGIDRIDNAKDYVPENVVAACKTCNLGRHIQTPVEFIDWARRLVAFQDQGF